MLARILHEHPDVLSVSEFFVHLTVQAEDVPAEHMYGEELWQALSTSDKFLDSVIFAGLAAPELRYQDGQGRFHPSTGVPMICPITLPMLSEDPDKLNDQMEAEVRTWPRRQGADHYRALFSLLAGVDGAHQHGGALGSLNPAGAVAAPGVFGGALRAHLPGRPGLRAVDEPAPHVPDVRAGHGGGPDHRIVLVAGGHGAGPGRAARGVPRAVEPAVRRETVPRL